MIGYLKGKVIHAREGRLLVGVFGTGQDGVGYSVLVPDRAPYSDLVRGGAVELYIYTHVREDALDLFGFLSPEEKDLFLIFLSVNGIGPKLGIGILSGAAPDQLVDAVLQKDKDFLTAIPGVGKKTVERSVVELGDVIRKKTERGELPWGPGTSVRGAASGRSSGPGAVTLAPIARDARDALLGLGYRDPEVTALVQRLSSETTNASAQDLIKTALRQLAQ